MIQYCFSGQEITLSSVLSNRDLYKVSSATISPAPVKISKTGKRISRSTGWVARENCSVEVWSAGAGLVLKVANFRDFFIAPDGKAIMPVEVDSNLTELEQEVVLGPALVLALALGGKWCLHASAASFHNKGMVFLGESGYGKSTLAAYLDEAGQPSWKRIADDILPVSLSEGGLTGWTQFPQLKLPALMQPSLNLPETVLIDHVYLLDPGNSAATPTLKPLSRDETVRVILGNTAGSRMFTPELLTAHLAFCAQAARHVTGYRLSYAHQRDILPAVMELLEQSL